MAVGSDHTPFIVDSGRVEQLCHELLIAGIEPVHTIGRDGILAADVGLIVDACAVCGSAAAAKRLQEQVCDILASGCRLLVTILQLDQGDDSCAVFTTVCDFIRRAALDAGVSPAAIGIGVEVNDLPPQALWLRRCEALGDGSLFLLPGRALMCPNNRPPERAGHDRFWLQMWHLRRATRLRVAYADAALSQCPLLSDERAGSILPTTAIQVPPGSAWIALRLDVSMFADGRGSTDDGALQQALCRAVEVGEELHELMAWPNAQMRHDAWLNRRLAIMVTGFGDLLRLRGLDPCDFAALQDLSATVMWVQDVLLQQSQRIATKTDVLPALRQADPSHALPVGPVRNNWRKRWRLAMEQAPIRHRNMLVLSPWSLFPAGVAADIRYANLLPLLKYADACAFSRPSDLSHWSVAQLQSFHLRAWAVLQQRRAWHQIAE
ncbi:MAG: hypothetical protein OEM25_03710 [Gammaproteobacteria bacterium]|nr:hypothetical protein [Gammaproteobacteria bacterium]